MDKLNLIVEINHRGRGIEDYEKFEYIKYSHLYRIPNSHFIFGFFRRDKLFIGLSPEICQLSHVVEAFKEDFQSDNPDWCNIRGIASEQTIGFIRTYDSPKEKALIDINQLDRLLRTKPEVYRMAMAEEDVGWALSYSGMYWGEIDFDHHSRTPHYGWTKLASKVYVSHQDQLPMITDFPPPTPWGDRKDRREVGEVVSVNLKTTVTPR